MRLAWFVTGLAAFALLAHAADSCSGSELSGPYGFQLYGVMKISPTPNPAAVLGRLVFDGQGSLSGVSSVNFNGFFLGNPVTGSYEIHSDCSLSFKLQDDSGGFQNFGGTVQPDGTAAQIHQSDPGTGGRGVLKKTPDACKTEDIKGGYDFTLTGVSTPLGPGEAGESVSRKGVIDADGSGGFTLTEDKVQSAGTYTVDSDCFAQVEFAGPDDAMKLRAIVVNNGKVTNGREVLAIETNPERTGMAKFTAAQ